MVARVKRRPHCGRGNVGATSLQSWLQRTGMESSQVSAATADFPARATDSGVRHQQAYVDLDEFGWHGGVSGALEASACESTLHTSSGAFGIVACNQIFSGRVAFRAVLLATLLGCLQLVCVLVCLLRLGLQSGT